MMITILKSLFSLFRETFQKFSEDRVPRLAAALAYYTAFSIAPLLVVTISIVGLVVSNDTVQQQIITQVNTTVGQNAGDLIQQLIQNQLEPSSGIISAVLGVVTLLLGAIGVFSHLQASLNIIWNVTEAPSGGILNMIQRKLLSFGMLLVVGFLLLVSLIASTAISALETYATGLIPAAELFIRVLNLAISFGGITVLFALIFKFLPDTNIEWRDVWVGAAFTSLLFTLGKAALSLYLAKSSPASAYGAAGAFVLILLWVFYSSQIILFGAEFTYVYSRRYGSNIIPEGMTETEYKREILDEPVEEERFPEEMPAGAVAIGKRKSDKPIPTAQFSRAEQIKLLILGIFPLILGVIASLLPFGRRSQNA